jgi:hypothetical protein
VSWTRSGGRLSGSVGTAGRHRARKQRLWTGLGFLWLAAVRVRQAPQAVQRYASVLVQPVASDDATGRGRSAVRLMESPRFQLGRSFARRLRSPSIDRVAYFLPYRAT